jgi:hypothetical protein
MNGSELRARYLEALKFPGEGKPIEAALARAHEIRKFEIELYWKRANYFWLFQAAAFTAFGLFWREGSDEYRSLAVAFAGIGFLTAWAAWLSAQGSKFWQENWEKHIDLLEDDLEGRLHKTVWIDREGLRPSVSRVNQRLQLILAGFWGALLLATAWLVLHLRAWAPPSEMVAVFTLIAAGAGALWLWCARSTLEGEICDDGAPGWRSFRPRKPKTFRILRRYAPGEDGEK